MKKLSILVLLKKSLVLKISALKVFNIFLNWNITFSRDNDGLIAQL